MYTITYKLLRQSNDCKCIYTSYYEMYMDIYVSIICISIVYILLFVVYVYIPSVDLSIKSLLYLCVCYASVESGTVMCFGRLSRLSRINLGTFNLIMHATHIANSIKDSVQPQKFWKGRRTLHLSGQIIVIFS